MNNPRLMMQRSELSGDKDRTVQQTDVDALQSRCSAVNAGYLKDPFANLCLEAEGAAGGPEKPRRYPLINRGAWRQNQKGKKKNNAMFESQDFCFFRLTKGSEKVS